ncbi:hypothetical protein HMPREF9123_1199 [Neisseria bacilliformis ATCC BAA-1200]|uniref:Uncharacterized protein n=1 Tax=Neisseria bacilliformis ATCC BAA-1200 TaxID=888742 RepID=F2BBU4_9NEIS|nr:hypothetical protein HMPREF9123_1199 [Neisseria bacilliformis ATCC BAA-1200]
MLFTRQSKPRAWLRHTPYMRGRGRLKKQNPILAAPKLRFQTASKPPCPTRRKTARSIV